MRTLTIDSAPNQGHNQTVGLRLLYSLRTPSKEVESCMNNVASPFNVVTQDVPLASREIISLTRLSGANPVLSEEIIHELRQPLGAIDSLAYYLELTAVDDKICTHLERIRAMVSEANGILERASGTHREMLIGNPYLAGS